MSEKSVVEFFAGIGLMRMGLEEAGWRVVWANDIDDDKMRMYRAHFTDKSTHFHLGDIHDIDPNHVPTVQLATASFPCNDLSLAGGRRGLAGRHSGAFWGLIRLLSDMSRRRPPIVLLENVPGFLTSNDGNDFRVACLALNDLGYLVDAFIIDAALFLPQSRQRLFVVGRRDKGKSDMAAETASFYESQFRPRAVADFILWNPDISWSIRELPAVDVKRPTLAQLLDDLPGTSRHWWSHERAEYLLSQMSPKHRAKAEEMIGGSAVSYGTVFRRVRYGKSMAELRTDGLAGCLRTPRGGSGRQILFKAGKGGFSVRLLTPRECARLMGADDYRITVPMNQALFGFGDAVCVPVIRWIAENYLTPVWEELRAMFPEHQTQYVKKIV